MLISHFLVECEDHKPNAATEFLKVPKLFKSELFRDPYYDLNQRNRTQEDRQNRIEQNRILYFTSVKIQIIRHGKKKANLFTPKK